MTRLLEGYIANEADISVDSQCWQTCDHYSYAQHRRCYDHAENCAVDPPCEGKILNCDFVDSDMWICPVNIIFIECLKENKSQLNTKSKGH